LRGIVVIARLDTGAGGEATLLDYAFALAGSGIDITILVGRSTGAQRRKIRQRIRVANHLAGDLRLFPVARVFDMFGTKSVSAVDFKRPRRLRITATRFLFNPGRLVTKSVVAQAKFLFASQSISGLGISQLRELNPSISLFLNHNGSPDDFSNKWDSSRKWLNLPTKKDYENYLSEFDKIVFQSTAHESEFRMRHPKMQITLATVWPSCNEDQCSVESLSSNPFPAKMTNLLCVGKFQSSKHQLELTLAFIEIAPIFPKATLTFIGGRSSDSTYLDKCVEAARDSEAAERIKFLGRLENPYRYVAHCDLFVFPSSAEGVSRAIREASYLGKPIMCQDISGLYSFLGDAGAIYFEGHAKHQIVSGLKNALRDPDRFREVGMAARRRYQELSAWSLFKKNAVRLMLDNVEKR
jgi:glycosyltransferase involved in cell wall biosynthesis